MSPKQQRGEATVQRVLDAALRIYAAEGEPGLTVGALTKESGVSAGSVYHHFGSLQGVFARLAVHWFGQLLEVMVAAMQQSDDARTGVGDVVRAYLAFVRDHPDAARLVHSIDADRLGMQQNAEIRDNQEARLTPIAVWLAGHRDAGQLADLPVPLIESILLGPVVGVARRWLTVADIDLDEAMRTLPEHVWRAVRR